MSSTQLRLEGRGVLGEEAAEPAFKGLERGGPPRPSAGSSCQSRLPHAVHLPDGSPFSRGSRPRPFAGRIAERKRRPRHATGPSMTGDDADVTGIAGPP